MDIAQREPHSEMEVGSVFVLLWCPCGSNLLPDSKKGFYSEEILSEIQPHGLPL